MKISAHFVFAVLLSLAASWLHYVIVPHHYCSEHKDWVHEEGSSIVADFDFEDDDASDESEVLLAYQPHSHEKCDDCITHRKFFQVVNLSGVNSAFQFGLSSVLPPNEITRSVAVFLLAPKNSPPSFS